MKKAVVIDNGSHTIKAGIVGYDVPKAIFPSIVGRIRHAAMMVGMGLKDPKAAYVGDEAQRKRGLLTLKYPIEQGIIVNWDDIEKIWHNVFTNELSISSEEHPVLLTESPLNTNANREKMMEIMFETFNSPALYIGIQPVLSLYSSGRTTGVVLDIGKNITHAVPIEEGMVIPKTVTSIELGGKDLDYYLMKIITEDGICSLSNGDFDIVRDIKEKTCYFSIDYEKEMLDLSSNPNLEESYELPDGNTIVIKNERFRCPEVLFQPTICRMDSPGIHQIIVNAVKKCNPETQGSLYSNILLSGCTSDLPGFAERMEKEISIFVQQKVSIISSLNRGYSAWIGGSLIASHPTFLDSCTTREKWKESGHA